MLAAPAMPRWRLDDLPWDRFRADLVDAELLGVVKAAALVEGNSASYGRYLAAVFHDDPRLGADAARWAAEEEQHGAALRRWAGLADPAWDGELALARFAQRIRLPDGAAGSQRGSRLHELVARCTVEVGTSSFYSALRDSAAEPVLRALCARIAADEFAHYRLFLDHARRHGAGSRLGRLRICLGRIAETGDDELAYAWWCGQGGRGAYRRAACAVAYHLHALRRYRSEHIACATRMLLNAAGWPSGGRLAGVLGRVAWVALRLRVAWLRSPLVAVAAPSPSSSPRSRRARVLAVAG